MRQTAHARCLDHPREKQLPLGEYSTPGAETGLLSIVSNTAGIHFGAACTMPVCISHPQVDKLIFYKRLYLKAKQ